MHFEIFDSCVYKGVNFFHQKFFPHFCCKFFLSCGLWIIIMCLWFYLTNTKTHFLTIFKHFEQTFCNRSILSSKLLFFKQLRNFFKKYRVPFVFMKYIVSIYVLWYLKYLLIVFWISKLISKFISKSSKRLSWKYTKTCVFQKNALFVPSVCIKNFKFFFETTIGYISIWDFNGFIISLKLFNFT